MRTRAPGFAVKSFALAPSVKGLKCRLLTSLATRTDDQLTRETIARPAYRLVERRGEQRAVGGGSTSRGQPRGDTKGTKCTVLVQKAHNTRKAMLRTVHANQGNPFLAERGDTTRVAPPIKKCHVADFLHKSTTGSISTCVFFLYDLPSLCHNVSYTFDPKMHHLAMDSYVL